MILERVQDFLCKVGRGEAKVDEKHIDEFLADVKATIVRRFSEQPREKFTLRASNVGRPLCQLQMEAANIENKTPDQVVYSDVMRNMFGDLIESLAVLVLKASGNSIEALQKPVTANIADTKLNGTLDIKIDGKIYDIKSCSKYAFAHKFGPKGGFNRVREDDPFGYVVQGYIYSEAENVPFGGWIAINKETGEWNVVTVPPNDGEYKKQALDTAATTIRAFTSNAPFKRCFDDEEEVFNKKVTGNTYLGVTCSFCPHKFKCWPGVVLKPQAKSKAQNPKLVWYTKYVEDKPDGEDSTEQKS